MQAGIGCVTVSILCWFLPDQVRQAIALIGVASMLCWQWMSWKGRERLK